MVFTGTSLQNFLQLEVFFQTKSGETKRSGPPSLLTRGRGAGGGSSRELRPHTRLSDLHQTAVTCGCGPQTHRGTPQGPPHPGPAAGAARPDPGPKGCAGNLLGWTLPPLGLTCHYFNSSEDQQGGRDVSGPALGAQQGKLA